MTAAPGQGQLQRRDRHPQAAPAVGRRGLGVGLGDRQVRGRIVQASPGQVTPGAHQGQLRICAGARREGVQQHLDGLGLPVEGQAERMIGQQPGRVRPVARCLRVPDGVGDLAVPGEPSGGPPVQHRHVLGQRPARLQPEQVGEQLVVPEPGPPGVKRDHERVRVLEFQQDPFRARVAGQQVGQLAVDPVEQRGAQEQILDFAGLAVQHLGQQVLRDRPVGSGELRDELLRGRVIREGQRGQPQAGGPALGPLVQQRRPGLGQGDARGFEQLAGLPLAELQVGRADLAQLVHQAQLVQAQPEIAAGRYDGVRLRREAGQQAGELGERLGRGQFVGIVDDEDDAITVLGQLGQHPVHHGAPVEVRRRGRRFVLGRAEGLMDGVDQVNPE